LPIIITIVTTTAAIMLITVFTVDFIDTHLVQTTIVIVIVIITVDSNSCLSTYHSGNYFLFKRGETITTIIELEISTLDFMFKV